MTKYKIAMIAMFIGLADVWANPDTTYLCTGSQRMEKIGSHFDPDAQKEIDDVKIVGYDLTCGLDGSISAAITFSPLNFYIPAIGLVGWFSTLTCNGDPIEGSYQGFLTVVSGKIISRISKKDASDETCYMTGTTGFNTGDSLHGNVLVDISAR